VQCECLVQTLISHLKLSRVHCLGRPAPTIWPAVAIIIAEHRPPLAAITIPIWHTPPGRPVGIIVEAALHFAPAVPSVTTPIPIEGLSIKAIAWALFQRVVVWIRKPAPAETPAQGHYLEARLLFIREQGIQSIKRRTHRLYCIESRFEAPLERGQARCRGQRTLLHTMSTDFVLRLDHRLSQPFQCGALHLGWLDHAFYCGDALCRKPRA
jgi:hypothetical protein